MSHYFLKRLSQGFLLILTVSILVFSMMHMMPGDPIDLMVDRRVSQERRDEMRAQYGLDKSLPEQYLMWLERVFQGDLGTSIRMRQPVTKIFGERLPVTLEICGISLLLELLIAIPIGLLAAYKKGGLFDRITMSLSLFFAAIPSFWTAVMLILIFGVTLKCLPISGFSTPAHYVLPIASMVLGTMASTIRMTKTEVLDVLHEKYIRTAYAKGLVEKQVLVRHVLRNALVLVTVMVFMNIPWLIGGAVIIENIFVIPGMGSLLTNSILNQDFAVVQACVLIISALTVLCNLICDMVTAILDPRIRNSMGGDNA